MAERHTVEMLLLRPGIVGNREALERLAEALPEAEVGRPDDSGVFEITLGAADQDDALQKVWDAVAASGADDHVVFLEHPEHWRARSGRPA